MESVAMRMKKVHFSLVELLIVVAIISILMSILMPALRKARDKAMIISCLGNARQIGIAWCGYSMDYDDIVVPGSAGTDSGDWCHRNVTGPDGAVWVYLMRDYLAMPDLDFNPGNPLYSNLNKRYRNQLMKCPANPEPPKYHVTVHYGMLTYNIGGRAAYGRDVIWRYAQIKNPSDKVIYMDSYDTRPEYSGHCSVYNDLALVDFKRHGGSSNAVHADGHAETWLYRRAKQETIQWWTNKHFGFDL